MAQLKPAAIEGFLKAPDKETRAVLVYGPDAGLVRERSDALARRIVPDFTDPFNFLELTDAELKADPARLADEAAAISMMGGERVIRIRTKGDASAETIKYVVSAIDSETLPCDALILVEAGELAKRSKLRVAFEQANRAVSMPCYEDNERSLRAVITQGLQAEGLRIDADALAMLAGALGADRGVTRAELEKLILYKGPQGAGRDSDVVSVADVRSIFADAASEDADALVFAAAEGRVGDVEAEFARLAAAGTAAITVLRALARHFDRLHTAASSVAEGVRPPDALKRL
ncbi:MAG: DNA polymerase III subunit delta, partial [Pseudomonadota bacterium]